jgi:hypothetical protein
MSPNLLLSEPGATALPDDPDYDPPCECHFAGDTFDPRGCPAPDPEVKQPWA